MTIDQIQKSTCQITIDIKAMGFSNADTRLSPSKFSRLEQTSSQIITDPALPRKSTKTKASHRNI